MLPTLRPNPTTKAVAFLGGQALASIASSCTPTTRGWRKEWQTGRTVALIMYKINT